MRTTLTLDEDVRGQLERRMRQTGKSFKDTVNETLRRGLAAQSAVKASKRFSGKTFPIEPQPGLNFDRVNELIEQIDGPWHR